MKTKSYYFLILLLGYSVITLSGCAILKETAKGIAGISTKELDANRKDALKNTLSYSYSACYDKTLEILSHINAYIYARKKGLIAVYVSPSDTTPVGIYFKEIDAQSTHVEVSSPSTYAKELIAKRLWQGLEKTETAQ